MRGRFEWRAGYDHGLEQLFLVVRVARSQNGHRALMHGIKKMNVRMNRKDMDNDWLFPSSENDICQVGKRPAKNYSLFVL